MTEEMMNLRTLLEKCSDAELLREMVGFAAQRLMELEVEGLTGAAHGARSESRINHRNGYRDRAWETRAGLATSSATCSRTPQLLRNANVRAKIEKLDAEKREQELFNELSTIAVADIRKIGWLERQPQAVLDCGPMF